MATTDDDLDSILAQALGGFKAAAPTVSAPAHDMAAAPEPPGDLPVELLSALQGLTTGNDGSDVSDMQRLLAQLAQSLTAETSSTAATQPGVTKTAKAGASSAKLAGPAPAPSAAPRDDDLGLGAMTDLLQRAAQLEQAAAGGAEVSEAELQQMQALMQSLMSELGAGLEGEGSGDGASGSAAESGAAAAADNAVPDELMETMIGSLLSKELIYPSLTEVADKYPPWLRANASHPEFARFVAQHACVREICTVYEDSVLDSKSQTRKVMTLMEKMQSHGAPPAEIIASVGNFGLPGMPTGPGGFDLGSMASVPGSCCVM